MHKEGIESLGCFIHYHVRKYFIYGGFNEVHTYVRTYNIM